MSHFTFQRYWVAELSLVLIAAAVGLGGCATAGGTGITRANVAEAVEQARTSADHERLAAYFAQEAQVAKDKAEECRQQRHRLMRSLPSGLIGVPGTSPLIRGHYEQLIEGHERNARAYEALAEAHRQMAESGAPGGAQGEK